MKYTSLENLYEYGILIKPKVGIKLLSNTVRGKILEGENFGESLLMKQMARKILANLLAGLQLFHCIYNY